MRQRIFDMVGPARDGDYASRAYDLFIVFVAVISLIPMLFDPSKTSDFENDALWILDITTAYLLLFDYVLRWMTHDIKTGKGWRAFFIYPFTPMAIIDILAILPTLNLVPQALRFLRILRIVKVFRYSKNLLVIRNAVYHEARTLGSVFIAVVVYMLVVALIIFNVEPESFNNYFDAVCWACTSMTSVSFSDSRPVGYIGQTLSIVSSLVALLVVALPAGVITGAYINEIRESKKEGSRYFMMASRTKIHLKSLDNPKEFFHKNRKVLRYILVIVSCVVVNAAISLFLIAIGSPVWLSSLGAALTAFLLEPAAGIIVAFIAAVIATFVLGDTTSMLFFFSYATVALGFGFVFPREDSKHKYLLTLALLLILVLGCGTIDVGVHLIQSKGDITAEISSMVSSGYTGMILVSSLELPSVATLFLGVYLDRLIETIPLSILFVIIVKLFGVHAAPSEKERKQQQAILLERALAREELENEEMRRVARRTIERKLDDTLWQQRKLDRDIATLESRLAEMNPEEDESNSSSKANPTNSTR